MGAAGRTETRGQWIPYLAGGHVRKACTSLTKGGGPCVNSAQACAPGKGPLPNSPRSLPTSILFQRLREVLKKYLDE